MAFKRPRINQSINEFTSFDSYDKYFSSLSTVNNSSDLLLAESTLNAGQFQINEQSKDTTFDLSNFNSKSPETKVIPSITEQNDVVYISKFIGYYGEINTIRKFYNDFQVHFGDIKIMSRIFGNSMIYAAESGNFILIKFIIQKSIGSCWSLQEYFNDTGLAAIRHNNINIFMFLFEHCITARTYFMDLSVYTKKLDLLQNLYVKYGTKVSEDAIKYCIENKMTDYIIYFISEMKIEL